MTVRENLHQYLTGNGLWDDEADAILASIESDETHYALNEVLDKKAEGYPIVFFAAANLTVRHQALDWIDTNKPMHFAQFMLDKSRMKKAQSATSI